jgi:hypothetical protein
MSTIWDWYCLGCGVAVASVGVAVTGLLGAGAIAHAWAWHCDRWARLRKLKQCIKFFMVNQPQVRRWLESHSRESLAAWHVDLTPLDADTGEEFK